ncbi:MAG TPA: T9SS type A sorting domain-containing protein, partial [Bacteroidales bacterium]|nr:T9SS type A sorting domain-containing protein [Bacteroidales bacterium]
EHVKVAISNSGTWDIAPNSIIPVSYSINGSPPVTESFKTEEPFEKGSVIYYTFNTVADYKIPGNYDISVWVKHASDLLSLNDTMKASFKILETPYVDISERDTIVTLNPLTLHAPLGYLSYKWQNGSVAPSYEITEPGASRAKVVITGTNGCSAADSVYVIFDKPDIGINSIVMPVTCISPMGKNVISFEVINKGFISIPGGTGIFASYSINKGPSITEIISPSVAIEPGKTGILKFSTPYDPNEASFTLDIKIEKSDIDLSNNIISGNIILRNTPPVDLGAGKDTLFYSVLPFSLDAGRGFASYKWQDGSDGEKFTATEEGLYWVSVSDINGCSDTDTVYVSLTDKEQSSFPGTVSIYPNPVSDFLNLLIDLDERRDIRIDLMNLGGKINYIEDFRDIMTLDKKIDVTSMAPGLYFVRITSGKSQFISRIIVY